MMFFRAWYKGHSDTGTGAAGDTVPLDVPRDILPAVRAFRDQLVSMGVEVVLKRLEATAPKEKVG